MTRTNLQSKYKRKNEVERTKGSKLHTGCPHVFYLKSCCYQSHVHLESKLRHPWKHTLKWIETILHHMFKFARHIWSKNNNDRRWAHSPFFPESFYFWKPYILLTMAVHRTTTSNLSIIIVLYALLWLRYNLMTKASNILAI